MKKELNNIIIFEFIIVFCYMIIIFLAISLLREGLLLNIIVFSTTFIFLILCIYGVKKEIEVGYYECMSCHHKYNIKANLKVIFSPYINTTRYLKCPKCGKRTWSKKLFSKE